MKGLVAILWNLEFIGDEELVSNFNQGRNMVVVIFRKAHSDGIIGDCPSLFSVSNNTYWVSFKTGFFNFFSGWGFCLWF